MSDELNIDLDEFSDEAILAVLGSGRTRGAATGILDAFNAEGSKMRRVNTAERFPGKDDKQVQQAFVNAKNGKNGTKWENITVKRVEGHDTLEDGIYLLNMTLLSSGS